MKPLLRSLACTAVLGLVAALPAGAGTVTVSLYRATAVGNTVYPLSTPWFGEQQSFHAEGSRQLGFGAGGSVDAQVVADMGQGHMGIWLDNQTQGLTITGEADLELAISGSPDTPYTVSMAAHAVLSGVASADAWLDTGLESRAVHCFSGLGCLGGDSLTPITLAGSHLIRAVFQASAGGGGRVDGLHSWDIAISAPAGTQVIDASGLVRAANVSAVPEPNTALLALVGVATLLPRARRTPA